MRDQVERSLHAKYGGVHFTQLQPAQAINEFVRALPEDKRDSIFEVMQELDRAGYIRLGNDEAWFDPEGEQHP